MSKFLLAGLGVFVVSAAVFLNSMLELWRMRYETATNTRRRRRKSVVSFLQDLRRMDLSL